MIAFYSLTSCCVIIALISWLLTVNSSIATTYFKAKDDISMLKHHMKVYKNNNNIYDNDHNHNDRMSIDDQSTYHNLSRNDAMHFHHINNEDVKDNDYLNDDYNTSTDQLLNNHLSDNRGSRSSGYQALNNKNNTNNNKNINSSYNNDNNIDNMYLNEYTIDEMIFNDQNNSHAAEKKIKTENFVLLALVNALHNNESSTSIKNESSSTFNQEINYGTTKMKHINTTTRTTKSITSIHKQGTLSEFESAYNNIINNNNTSNNEVCYTFQNEQRIESLLLCASLIITIWSSIFQAAFFAYIKSSSSLSSSVINIEQTLYFARLLSDFIGRPLTFLPRPFFVKVIIIIYLPYINSMNIYM